jgi:hypothetical protein
MRRRVAFRSLDSDSSSELRDPRLEGDGWFRCAAVLGDANGEDTVEFGMIPHFRGVMVSYFEDVSASAHHGWRGEKT